MTKIYRLFNKVRFQIGDTVYTLDHQGNLRADSTGYVILAVSSVESTLLAEMESP